MKKLIAGNWKMNGTLSSSIELAQNIVEGIQGDPQILEKCDFLVCPPYPYLVPVMAELTQAVSIGTQDCSSYQDGAYTGDVSAHMLHDIGCSYVILGHSERRQHFGETDDLISEKAALAHQNGLVTIICVGETEQEREQGRARDVVAEQLRESLPTHVTAENTVIAYEPVWAIGTGKSATPEDVGDMHGFIRAQLTEQVEKAENLRILYGGSVKPGNAGDIFAVPHVDGALIGGASLKAEDFLGIAQAA